MWKSGSRRCLCEYSAHLDYCGSAARSLGSKHANLMFSLLAGALVPEAWLIPAKEGVYGVSQSWQSSPLWMHTRQLCLDPHAGSMSSSAPLGLGRLQTPAVAPASQAHSPGTLLCWYLLFKPSFWDHCCTTGIIKGFLYTGHMQLVNLMAEIQSRRNVYAQFSLPWALEHILDFGFFISNSSKKLP